MATAIARFASDDIFDRNVLSLIGDLVAWHTPNEENHPIMDEEMAMSQVCGEREFLLELIGDFLTEKQAWLASNPQTLEVYDDIEVVALLLFLVVRLPLIFGSASFACTCYHRLV